MVKSTIALTSASFATSARMNAAAPPSCWISATTFAPSSSRRPERTTLAPARANSLAVVLPMPEVPPVTSATLSENVFVFIQFPFAVDRPGTRPSTSTPTPWPASPLRQRESTRSPGPARAGLSLLDGADHRRVVRLAPSRGGGGLQQPPRRSRLLERDARGLGQLDGVRQVFQDVPRGEGALRGVMVEQERLHPVIAEDEAVGGPLGERLEQHARLHCAGGAGHREGLGEGDHCLGDHHVVHELYRLARANASAVGHFRTHAPQERAEPGEERWLPAHHDAERAVAGGLRGARNRRVGEGGAARAEGLVEFARERHRTGAHVDHRLARGYEGGEASVGAEADRAHLRLSR